CNKVVLLYEYFTIIFDFSLSTKYQSMKKIFYSVGICILFLAPPSGAGGLFAQTPKSIQKHIDYLASDKLEGRGTGTEGGKTAAKYLEKQFKKLGLKPYGDKGTYLQEFPAKKGLPPNISYVQATNVVGFLDNGSDKTIIIGLTTTTSAKETKEVHWK
ncbi:MAG: hypothetical protein U5M51_07765, partial [Emticicia sp.]|nr:hypothetical protein [Emticicia sp.]